MKFHEPLQRYLLTCQANSAFLGRIFCTGEQQLSRLETQDFSPLIKWVLAGVLQLSLTTINRSLSFAWLSCICPKSFSSVTKKLDGAKIILDLQKNQVFELKRERFFSIILLCVHTSVIYPSNIADIFYGWPLILSLWFFFFKPTTKTFTESSSFWLRHVWKIYPNFYIYLFIFRFGQENQISIEVCSKRSIEKWSVQIFIFIASHCCKQTQGQLGNFWSTLQLIIDWLVT